MIWTVIFYCIAREGFIGLLLFLFVMTMAILNILQTDEIFFSLFYTDIYRW
jgi:hypothetical protein